MRRRTLGLIAWYLVGILAAGPLLYAQITYSSASSSGITIGTTAVSGTCANGLLNARSGLVQCSSMTDDGATVTLTNGVSAVSPLVVNDNVTKVFEIVDGGVANFVTTNGFAIGSLAGRRRIHSNGTDFWFLDDSNNAATIGASAAPILYAYGNVEAVTSTKTTSLNESGETYTNTGDTDGATITLLNDPTVGATWHFAVTVAQTLTIVASAGETLMMGSSTCGTSMTSSTIGATTTIRAVKGGSGGVYMTFGAVNWTCNP